MPLDLAQRQRDVGERSAVGEQVELLENHADTPAELVGRLVVDAFAIEQDVAGSALDEPVQATQQGRLAGAGWPDQAGDRSGLHLQTDVVQHLDGAIGHVDVLDLDAAALELR